MRWPDGSRVESNYIDGKACSENAILIYVPHDDNSRKNYRGGVLNDKHHGKGLLTWIDGRKYEGSFINGIIEG